MKDATVRQCFDTFLTLITLVLADLKFDLCNFTIGPSPGKEKQHGTRYQHSVTLLNASL